MTDAESPGSVFEMLYLFFPKAVRDVIYDNACHLLDYELNRDVEFAERTRPLVDEFHHPSHTSCAASFNTGELRHDWARSSCPDMQSYAACICNSKYLLRASHCIDWHAAHVPNRTAHAGLYRKHTTNPAFNNSSFAEQGNRLLDELKKGAANMHPLTLLWVVRMHLYVRSKKQAFLGKR